jgi:hypothetical protein
MSTDEDSYVGLGLSIGVGPWGEEGEVVHEVRIFGIHVDPETFIPLQWTFHVARSDPRHEEKVQEFLSPVLALIESWDYEASSTAAACEAVAAHLDSEARAGRCVRADWDGEVLEDGFADPGGHADAEHLAPEVAMEALRQRRMSDR